MASTDRSAPSTPAPHHAAVGRLLGSAAFGRSRLAAGRIVSDADQLRHLCAAVAEKDFADGPLRTGRPDLGAALALARDVADEVEQGRRAAGTPVEQAHRRLVVAALHYLVVEHDVIPDGQAGGSLDDLAILGWVCRAAHHELEPYLESHP